MRGPRNLAGVIPSSAGCDCLAWASPHLLSLAPKVGHASGFHPMKRPRLCSGPAHDWPPSSTLRSWLLFSLCWGKIPGTPSERGKGLFSSQLVEVSVHNHGREATVQGGRGDNKSNKRERRASFCPSYCNQSSGTKVEPIQSGY